VVCVAYPYTLAHFEIKLQLINRNLSVSPCVWKKRIQQHHSQTPTAKKRNPRTSRGLLICRGKGGQYPDKSFLAKSLGKRLHSPYQLSPISFLVRSCKRRSHKRTTWSVSVVWFPLPCPSEVLPCCHLR